MAKKPEDYFSELAKVKPSPKGFKPITERPKKSAVPKGLIFLLIGGFALFCFVTIFSSHDPRHAIISLEQHLPPGARTKVAQLLNKYTGSTTPTRTTASAGKLQTSPTVGIQGAGKPAQAKAAANAYIFIDGKWYKRTPNNIYMVNGHRVFYVNNH